MNAAWLLCGCLIGLSLASAAEAGEPSVAGRTLPEWSARLASPRSDERQQAAAMLGQLGPAGWTAGTAALSHQDPVVRYWAVAALTRLARDPVHRAKHGEEMAAPLKQAMADESPAVRVAAAAGLSQLGDPAGVAALAEALGHPQDAVGIQAAMALEALGERARPAAAAIRAGQQTGGEYVKRICERIARGWEQ